MTTFPGTNGFRCDVEPHRERMLVRPVGELNLATVPFVQRPLEELHAAGFRDFLLDLRRVTFMDSTGLRLLVRWASASAQDGFELRILIGTQPVRRLLELTGALERLPIVEADDLDPLDASRPREQQAS